MIPAIPEFTKLSGDAAAIVTSVLQQDRRVLLFGAPGVGKSTLASELAECLAQARRPCWCLSADPGSPPFGLPGAVTLGQWQQDGWQVEDCAALCTLDGGRFRLPLVSALRRLLHKPLQGTLLVDSPGVVRGAAGRELLEGLVEASRADLVLVIARGNKPPPLADELHALPLQVCLVAAAEAAVRPGKRARNRQRTQQWDQYLDDAVLQKINLDSVSIVGTPPPVTEPSAWIGRQVAILKKQQMLAMGEVERLHGRQLSVNLPVPVDEIDSLLVRDAGRSTEGKIATIQPWLSERLDYLPPADVLPPSRSDDGPRPVGRVGSADIAMLNGVFGDPLLHIRLRHQRRSLLFDLGSSERLSARLGHQVTDVFITHAHLDHIGGFIPLLRFRVGDFPPCRLYGPPGLATHISGLLKGALWDRVEISGPRFEVREFDGEYLRCFYLQATKPEPRLEQELEVQQGVICQDEGFRIRATLLDHQGTDVLAFAFEPDKQINVRKDRLLAHGLQPGSWLKELKRQLLQGNETATIELPDGSEASVAELAAELLLISPAKRLVYATDLADTEDNRRKLIALAQGAHTFFCEAPFLQEEAKHALCNGHLTTRACAEIAEEAAVARLVPFHFSRRYQEGLQQIYEELKAVCPRVIVPQLKNSL